MVACPESAKARLFTKIVGTKRQFYWAFGIGNDDAGIRNFLKSFTTSAAANTTTTEFGDSMK